MEKMIFIWLASIPLWMVLLASSVLIKKILVLFLTFWRKKSSQVKRKLYYDTGLVFTGSGGVGAILGITEKTEGMELQFRLVAAATFILLGVILILLNMED
ncbi:hypothetical protein JCM30760_27050 [Thiomicrorhabdus hydrogeniphila]